MRLTGNTRYRSTWTGKLVLQVQLADRCGTWRDARLEDMDCEEVRGELIGEYQPRPSIPPPPGRGYQPRPLVPPRAPPAPPRNP